MKLTKTEQKLLANLEGKTRAGTFGKRENAAARKLADKGLVKFTNTSELITPRYSNKRNSMGDYVGYFVAQGYIESAS